MFGGQQYIEGAWWVLKNLQLVCGHIKNSTSFHVTALISFVFQREVVWWVITIGMLHCGLVV